MIMITSAQTKEQKVDEYCGKSNTKTAKTQDHYFKTEQPADPIVGSKQKT